MYWGHLDGKGQVRSPGNLHLRPGFAPWRFPRGHWFLPSVTESWWGNGLHAFISAFLSLLAWHPAKHLGVIAVPVFGFVRSVLSTCSKLCGDHLGKNELPVVERAPDQ